MKNTDAQPPYETLEIGTPLDYTSDIYRVYLEVGENNDTVKDILIDFMGIEKKHQIVSLVYGYEIEIPMQCIPEIVRLIVNKNIAVYQVNRISKTKNTWG